MDYLNQIGTQYGGLLTVLGSIFGTIGFMFGAWRYHREQQAQQAVIDRQRELDAALARLHHLETYASGLVPYSKAG